MSGSPPPGVKGVKGDLGGPTGPEGPTGAGAPGADGATGTDGKDGSTGLIWEGEGLNEVGRRKDNGDIVIKIDPRYYRPNEVNYLRGDSKKAKRMLGWKPRKKFQDIVKEMVTNDLKKIH